jgi:hypothetical protein
MAAMASLLLFVSAVAWADHHEGGKVYELRTYTTNEGKLDALHSRFRDHTIRLFEKHGMKTVGYWIPVDKSNTLVYMMVHESVAVADASWKAFFEDPEWQNAYAASIADGKLVAKVDSVFLRATEYSPLQ